MPRRSEPERMNVIIAEDESLIRMDLREMLEEDGHDIVAEANNGAEAVELTRSHKPHIVFMDVEMPEMNGLEAARIIGEEKLAPVVIVTAFSQRAYVKEAAEAGAMAYLTKPFTKQDIMPAMEVAVARFTEAITLAEQVKDLDERLETRKLVDRAKGMLMDKGMSEADAFHRLQKLAMDKRIPLKQVAEAVILADEAGVEDAGGTTGPFSAGQDAEGMQDDLDPTSEG
jgi:response regulator NasT